MERERKISVRKYRKDREEGREWIKLFFSLFLTLTVGILIRIGVISEERVAQAIKGNAPGVSWKEHTQETLARIGELFYGENEISG